MKIFWSRFYSKLWLLLVTHQRQNLCFSRLSKNPVFYFSILISKFLHLKTPLIKVSIKAVFAYDQTLCLSRGPQDT